MSISLQVNDFLSVLDGLEAADGLPEIYSSARVESALLRKIVLPLSNGGQFPDMTTAVSFFRNAFDAVPAKKDGVIKPKPGVDPFFDEAKVNLWATGASCIGPLFSTNRCCTVEAFGCSCLGRSLFLGMLSFVTLAGV